MARSPLLSQMVLGMILLPCLCVNQLLEHLLCVNPPLLRNYFFSHFDVDLLLLLPTDVKIRRNGMNEGQVLGKQEGGQGW